MSKNNCPTCGYPLVLFYSTHKKYCPDCRVEFAWELTPGQKSTLIEGLTAENQERQPPVAVVQTKEDYEEASHGE